MATLLKYIGKGQWQKIDEANVLPTDKVRPKTRVKLTQADRTSQFLDNLNKSIEKSGYCTIRVSRLVEQFGFSKRSEKNLAVVHSAFKDRRLYTLPTYSNELKLDSSIRIYSYPVRQLGELFKTEKELEDYVARHEHYKQLNIKSVVRQHSPKGSKDKLDFKGQTSEEELVVLELKNGGGGKSSVEQVIRYGRLLKQEHPDAKIRLVLVTGIQNYETSLAIRGLHPEQQEVFEWYLYKYHKADDYFKFERVALNEMEEQTPMS